MPEIGFGLAVATAYYKNLCNSVQFHPRDEIGLNYINLLIIPGMTLDRKGFVFTFNIFITSSSLSFEGYPLQVDTNRTGTKGLSFYYPRLLYCLNQMLAVVLLSRHRISSSKTIRPRAPCGARCIGHVVRTWSAVCSEAPHSQFGVAPLSNPIFLT